MSGESHGTVGGGDLSIIRLLFEISKSFLIDSNPGVGNVTFAGLVSI